MNTDGSNKQTTTSLYTIIHDDIMQSSAFPNEWWLREVASTAIKPCMVCYKSTSFVLITPDQKDFFYICKSHVEDKAFAEPTEEERARIDGLKQQADIDQEVEKVKIEYAEKLKQKNKDNKDDTKKKDDAQGLEQEKQVKVYEMVL